MTKPRGARSRPARPSASPVRLARSVPHAVTLRLVAASAGRCELRGCNEDLYIHPVTSTPGNFAQQAHIVAFRPDGPRGGAIPRAEINTFENLMLLGANCHHLIDTNRDDYPIPLLREHKREHEERIFALTALGPEFRTTVIQLRGTIGGQPVDIPAGEIRDALLPRYPARLPGVLIDLAQIRQEGPAFFDIARNQIRLELRPAIRAELEAKRVQHYSVFALAPIPVLACLGRELGDKVTVDVFQRHRDPQSWKWKADGAPVEYEFRRIRQGTDQLSVALLLSLSGHVSETFLPPDIDQRFTLYEIIPKGTAPDRELLRQREDLVRFRRAYQRALATIQNDHDGLQDLHLFPAVPAPVAVACGQELLPKAHVDLVIYDNIKGTFQHAITINTREDL